MTAHTVAEAFAAAAARLTGSDDVAGNLMALLGDCVALMDVNAAGLLVHVPGEGLELLSTTSHAATVLELYELQNGRGPCIEAVERNGVVSAGSTDLALRWTPVGSAILEAGYQAVYAFPLRWNDRAVGALNLFADTVPPLDAEREQLGQAFANMALAIVALPSGAKWAAVYDKIVQVLAERVNIERAKGVLAVQRDIDLAEAFTLLVEMAVRDNVPLADCAAQVLAGVQRPATDLS